MLHPRHVYLSTSAELHGKETNKLSSVVHFNGQLLIQYGDIKVLRIREGARTSKKDKEILYKGVDEIARSG